jgi:hypothetical protein
MNSRNDCGDCGVAVGEPHAEECDVARCLWTGGQRLTCKLARLGEDKIVAEYGTFAELLLGVDADHDCGADVWTGDWPGLDDATRLGWFIYWGPDFGEEGWVPCPPDHPGAQPDLNRLNPAHARWDREAKRWEKREEASRDA